MYSLSVRSGLLVGAVIVAGGGDFDGVLVYRGVAFGLGIVSLRLGRRLALVLGWAVALGTGS